jgi:[ribosomal protein S18]-alanine N-acetyltransferase
MLLKEFVQMGSVQEAIRQYREEDLEAMFRLDETCFSEEFRFDRRSMSAFAEARGAVTLIAEEEDGSEIVGFVIAQVKRVVTELQAYVVTLDVAPNWRRKGLAGRLMSKAEATAAAAGARWIQLHVFTGNEAAIRFYERIGYVRIRTMRGFYGAPGLDAFVYGKELQGL